ncbi:MULTISPECIES: lysylphosphatidylglycerol synthase transmembrane domain-containing protein [Flavobacteriaceae]|uniref:lysylphosphatidylglycerol synthase transmembrane domain-containing protein n=1 Tax=Flavobacteriaceae TaxID=49546 RepID=UPI0010AE5E4B|nr:MULTISPECIES: lysylphosphatidylglycerol synthase transmembrane domain-containing protein [Flavobacteriaceae]NJB36862.1 flippase-like domain-containing protein [Croceivirga sp. JEA036]TKD65324.1 flippase-like domain-containing protein [Flavobacterium sp. ASW18X]
MSPQLKKTLKLIVPIALGLFLVWYSYQSTSLEDRKTIVTSITNANPFWIGVSILIGIISHIARAIRWNYLLKPLGYQPKLYNNVLIVFLSYFANLGIPRSGEVLRATALTTYENVPFEKGFGTIVTERVIDLIMLLLVIFTALLLQTNIILGYLNQSGMGIIIGLAVLVLGIVSLVIVIRILKKSSSPFAKKINGFLNGLLDGITSILKMENKWLFIFYTFLIWFCYVAMFWVIKFTVLETADLSISQLLVAFVGGAFAMSTTNGGIGLYPIAVSGSLSLFGVSAIAGNTFGWIMWIAQTLMVVVFGAISFVLLPLLNRNR